MTRAAWEPKGKRCTAHRSSGEPCGAWALRGGNVCGMHGGRAAQVRNKARQRLDDMVDPALARLRKLVDARNDAVSLNAVKDILDRTGYKLPERVETDAAVTIKVEYETIDLDEQAGVHIVEPTITRDIAIGSYTNGTTTQHDHA